MYPRTAHLSRMVPGTVQNRCFSLGVTEGSIDQQCRPNGCAETCTRQLQPNHNDGKRNSLRYVVVSAGGRGLGLAVAGGQEVGTWCCSDSCGGEGLVRGGGAQRKQDGGCFLLV